MKRILYSLFWFLLLCNCVQAQKPQFSLTLGGGFWHPFVTYEEPYLDFSPHQNQRSLAMACGLDFHWKEHLSFAPEVGYEEQQYQYLGGALHSPSAITIADVWLGSIRLAPALKIGLLKGLFLRAGVDVFLPAGGVGSFKMTWKLPSGSYELTTYTSRFGRIRAAANVGPTLAVGYRFALGRGSALSTRLNGFLGLIPAFEGLPHPPVNPLMAKLHLEVSYTLPQRKSD